MMNKQEILRKIGSIIQELSEQHQYLSGTDKINILELELFTANADFLIDHIEILKKLNDVHTDRLIGDSKVEDPEPVIAENEVVTVPVEAEEQAPVEIPEEAKIPSFKFDFEEPAEMVFDFEKKVAVEEVFDRELTKEEQEVIDRKQQVLHIEDEEPPVQPIDETEETDDEEFAEPYLVTRTEQPVPEEEKVPEQTEQSVIEVFSPSTPVESVQEQQPQEIKPLVTQEDKKLSLNELLSSQRNPVQSYNRPITDLKASISLNDKMIFIRELFNGYNLAYSEAIEILNRFDSFEAADNFLLKNYAEKNNWAQKQDVVDRLYEILNRKFKN